MYIIERKRVEAKICKMEDLGIKDNYEFDESSLYILGYEASTILQEKFIQDNSDVNFQNSLYFIPDSNSLIASMSINKYFKKRNQNYISRAYKVEITDIQFSKVIVSSDYYLVFIFDLVVHWNSNEWLETVNYSKPVTYHSEYEKISDLVFDSVVKSWNDRIQNIMDTEEDDMIMSGVFTPDS